MTREQFIREHIAVCSCGRLKKYDRKKGEKALHSLAYSRRKCAKQQWRRLTRKG